MADGFYVDPGTGSGKLPVATDDISGTHYQIVKHAFGPLDTATLVTASVGLPVAVVGTVPVSGTFYQATQPVSIASTVTVTGAGGTFPATQSGTWNITNVSGTVSLPTGASTAAKQPALGTAGSASSDVLTVQGIASMTALKVDGSAVTQPVSGSLTTVSTVTAVTAITNALPAGTNLLGREASSLETSTIYNATTALTPKFAAISTASSGVSTVVAAVTSKKIRVLSYRFQADADVSVKFRDNTAAVDLTGAMATGAKGGGGGAAFSPVGHFETASGNALSINLSSAVQVSGHVVYVEV